MSSKISRHALQLVATLALVFLVASCSGRRPSDSVYNPFEIEESTPAENEDVQEVVPVVEPVVQQPVGPEILPYNNQNFKEPASSYDLQHTVLNIEPDFPNERIIGQVTHRLVVTAQLLTHVSFDAKDMQIRKVAVKRPGKDFEEVPFRYNNSDITFSLQPGVGKNVVLEVWIDFIAYPMKNGKQLGLYFVDGKGNDPSRPTQVWTLGQPEDNQYWFPTWDYPNDRMTTDMLITVPQQFSTVANGSLLEQKTMPNNRRQDRWVMDKPHVAYLVGFAAGEYHAVVDSYKRRNGSEVPLAYLVEPSHANNVERSLGETPEIMRFMENKVGLAYPWANYKQVVVRDFTANGMENTTATVLAEHVQHDARARLDYNARDLIVHELAHQWFGNLVTSRNWANLPLNEGFASYFELLYLEERYGVAAVQKKRIDELEDYLEDAEERQRPVIWHGYTDPNQMYDSHTYNKAALVLDQMRFELGDDVWWRGVRQYVRDNAFREVMVEDLQRAMEASAGRKLNGFFNQWYRTPGHPVLDVEHRFHDGQGIYEVQVRQRQDSLNVGDFRFKVNIELNTPGAAPWLTSYQVASRDTTFRFAISGDVSFVRFDVGNRLLADINVKKSVREWQNQARYDDEPAGRFDAVNGLADAEPNVNVRNVLLHVLQSDEVAFVREAAAVALVSYGSQEEVRTFLQKAATSDADSGVRREALMALSVLRDEVFQQALATAINDQSYVVTAEAIQLYADAYPQEAIQKMRPLYELTSWENTVEEAMIEAYGHLKAIEGIPYLQKQLSAEVDASLQESALKALAGIAQYNPAAQRSISGIMLESLNRSQNSIRLAAVEALRPIADEAVITGLRNHLQSEQAEEVRLAILGIVNQGN